MASVITFVFRSEAPYSQSELEGLKEELSDVAKVDDDFIEDSAEIKVQTTEEIENSSAADQAKIDDLVEKGVQEFMKSALITTTVKIEDPDGNVLAKVHNVSDSEV